MLTMFHCRYAAMMSPVLANITVVQYFVHLLMVVFFMAMRSGTMWHQQWNETKINPTQTYWPYSRPDCRYSTRLGRSHPQPRGYTSSNLFYSPPMSLSLTTSSVTAHTFGLTMDNHCPFPLIFLVPVGFSSPPFHTGYSGTCLVTSHLDIWRCNW